MRLLHREFKEAINQTAIAISPVVVIGKHRADGQPDAGHCITISSKTFTQPTFSMDHRILPLLLKFPSTSSSIDVGKAQYKTSSFSFTVSKARWGGKNLAEHLSDVSNSGLINQEVGFYLASEHNKYFGDSLKVYSGIIVKIKNTESSITIYCEDFSSEVLDKEIPYSKISFDTKGKFTPEPYPLNYGYYIYSKMYQTPSEENSSIVGVFDNPSAHYGDSPVKGVHFFDGSSEARMSKRHSGLFARWDKLQEQQKGNFLIGGEQWANIPEMNQVKFNQMDGKGDKNFFGDNGFEAQFHFNKLGHENRGTPTSNMAFETININPASELVDASEVKKFPLLTNVLGVPSEAGGELEADWFGNVTYFPGYVYQTWGNTSTYFVPYEFFYAEGYHLEEGIRYNNTEIVEEKNLNGYVEHYTTQNEYLRLIDLESETFVAGNIGFGP